MSDNQMDPSSNPQQNDLTLDKAKKLLAKFACADTPPQLSAAEKQSISEALLFVAGLSDYQTIGICAETVKQGQQAMESYLAALVRPVTLDLPTKEGPIYLKFNTQKGAWYLDVYSGKSRGVLVACHSTYEDGVNDIYGHLPLDLFMETSAKPK